VPSAFRSAFTRSCDLSEDDVATFARLAALNTRTDEHAHAQIGTVLGPATERLREAGGLRAGSPAWTSPGSF
jgi:hypothetical protein